ncbi:Mov34/MPN/PAD-1 family protein [Bacillus cereus]|nr:Mov34/MPN/PAD-1 family protein [Bacillus cereus]
MTDLFGFFDMETQVEETTVPVKKAASEQATAKKEEKKEKAKGKTKSSKKAKATKSTDCLDKINTTTVVRHVVFGDIPLVDWFTEEEITHGIAIQNGDSTDVRKIEAEDIRVKLEHRYPSFVKGLTVIKYDEDTNALIPILTVGAKGASIVEGQSISDCPFSFLSTWLNHFLPGDFIPRTLLMDFIIIAQAISRKCDCELHADIYFNKERGYFMDFPRQQVATEIVIPETNIEMQSIAMKVMEIHSHHRFSAEPSDLDDQSERAPILYAIVGRIEDVFPELRVRTCIDGKFHSINPNFIFAGEYATKGISQDYDLSRITLLK